MNYWLILGLAIVAMVATVVVFMWWWTTENWDWASAELKPPRTVPQEPGPVTVARRLAHHWQMLETLSDLSEIQTEQRKKLEQRVTALEDKTEILEFDLHELEVAVTPSPPPDLTVGPTASATTPTSLKDVKVHMEKTQAPTT